MTFGSRIKWLVSAAVFLTAGAWAQTVSLNLKNGDRVTGQILSETNNRVLLSNAWSAAISIPASEITNRIVIVAPIAIVATTNGVAAIATTNGAAKSNAVAVAKVVASTNNLFTSPWLKKWHGDIQAGVDLTFSERNRQVYNAKAKIIYAKNRLKNVFDY